MEQHALILLLLFISFFLFLTAMLQTFSKKYPLPYTVALLFAGSFSQLIGHVLHLDIHHITLSPDVIYYILLPLLLFESSFHIHIHQFRLQFKTITFFATFGLLMSIFVIGYGMTWILGLPLGVSLLFGALISATDPIAVISLFKTLGAPKRLGLIADGESMFNDATAVIAFRLIASFVLANAAFASHSIIEGLGNFAYIFVGSMAYGIILGYIAAKIIAKIQEDKLVETSLTIVLALFSFVSAEHFFHLSGVISTVMAGIVLGNLGKTKISPGVKGFVSEWWEYIAFFCVSLVFFFAAFNLDVTIFVREPMRLLAIIFLVLVARAVSVYIGAFITNKTPFFKDEPDIPMSWQHILNWGGLRGVIPLVLVYSLPDSFMYKEEILGFTLSTLVFTLVVNGLTIQWLLKALKLHVPMREEEIIHDEMHIFDIETARKKLEGLSKREFDSKILHKIDVHLQEEEERFREHLMKLAKSDEFKRSLQLQALEIERRALQQLFEQGRFTENVFYEFESELDVQHDALEHPEVRGRMIKREGMMNVNQSFRKRFLRWRRIAATFPFVSKLFGINESVLIRERYGLLRARIFTSFAVLSYLAAVEALFTQKNLKKAIAEVREIQQDFIDNNQEEMREIEQQFPEITLSYQKHMVLSLIHAKSPATSTH